MIRSTGRTVYATAQETRRLIDLMGPDEEGLKQALRLALAEVAKGASKAAVEIWVER